MLACEALGLSSCWIGAFDEKKVLEFLGNPENMKPVAILPIGYADEKPEKRIRKSLEEILEE